MSFRRVALLSSAVVFLATVACTSGSNTPNGADESSSRAAVSSQSVVAPSSMPVTHNVTYSGIVEKMEGSIYMQGSHRLMLDDGRFILLASSAADLEAYAGKRVSVHGSVEPSVEGDATIMHVESINEEQDGGSAPSSAIFCGGIANIQCPEHLLCVDDANDGCDPRSGGADCGGMCVEEIIASSQMPPSMESSTAVSTISSAARSVVPPASRHMLSSSAISHSMSASVSSASSTQQDQANIMAKHNLSAQFWTQHYCTSHVDVCVPVHKNWYYKSFGATTSNLWHVEIGNGPIENLSDGAIMINLVSGLSAPAGGTDGQVKTEGGSVIGYKDWGEQHFEVIAPIVLQDAVSYMLANTRKYTEQ